MTSDVVTRAGTAARLRLTGGAGADLDAHLRAHGPLPLPPPVRGPQPALIDEIAASGLRGRGGAGFPAARKLAAVAAGRRPVVVANGAEGEPESRKDRMLLTSSPHLVIDGALVAANAVGAGEIQLCLHRGSAAIPAVLAALAQRPAIDDPAGPTIIVQQLPRRYVASEESALVHWLNGGDAKPVTTPPRPFERGVGGRPTLVHNVETLAHLALIARYGAGWFRSTGAVDEPGTTLITAAGSVLRPGVYEVPTGTPIGAVLGAAGAASGSTAVLTGGYFGAWLRIDRAGEIPLTHAALAAAGGAMGAGVLLSLGPDSCGIAETARIAAYLAAQGAGQCGPCLNGLPAIAGALAALARGDWVPDLLPRLDRWLAAVTGRGACRHPDGTARLVASALHTFGGDVRAHAAGRPCPQARAGSVLQIPADLQEGWR